LYHNKEIGIVFLILFFIIFLDMTTIEKHIVKYIDDKFGFPYLHYSREEQTWVNEFFLFDIKTKTMYISDLVKFDLNKKYGKGYIDNVLLTVVNYWFKKTYKLEVIEVE
jgi:hypothetical protein